MRGCVCVNKRYAKSVEIRCRRRIYQIIALKAFNYLWKLRAGGKNADCCGGSVRAVLGAGADRQRAHRLRRAPLHKDCQSQTHGHRFPPNGIFQQVTFTLTRFANNSAPPGTQRHKCICW